MKGQGRDLEITAQWIDPENTGKNLGMLTKEIILSQEVQYEGGYGRIIIFPTNEVIVHVNNWSVCTFK